MTQNPAITKAYETGEYTDANGITWTRGLDGWFDYSDPRIARLEYASRMDALIEKENPMVVEEVDKKVDEKPQKKTRASRKETM